MIDQTAWLCAGNLEVGLLRVAVESLLVELARAGAHPVVIPVGPAPFSSSPLRIGTRDRHERLFEYFTPARVPALGIAGLERHLADRRLRAAFLAEATRYGQVYVFDPKMERQELLAAVDGMLLFVAKGAASASWIFQTLKKATELRPEVPIAIVVGNAKHLEDGAVFFHDVREEVASLLPKEPNAKFAGFLRFEQEYVEAALAASSPLVSLFPEGAFHGQVKRILLNVTKCAPQPMAEPFFSRAAARLEAGSKR
jgi:hypothetical protein